MKKMLFAAAILAAAGAAQAKLPLLNATCPGNVDVHVDEGGPVYVNGQQAQLKRLSDNYFEAHHGNLVIQINVNPDGSAGMSYNRGRANGICQIKASPNFSNEPIRPAPAERAPQGQGEVVSMGNLRAYCIGEASSMYGTRPTHIKAGQAARNARGGYTVRGTVDKGDEGIKSFACNYDSRRHFIEVMPLNSDGE